MSYVVKVTPSEGEPVEHPYDGYAKAFYKYTHIVKEQAMHCALVDCSCFIELIDVMQGIILKQTGIVSHDNR